MSARAVTGCPLYPWIARMSSPTRRGSVTEAKFLDFTGASASLRSAATSCWARCHGVPHDPPGQGSDPMRGLMQPPALDPPEGRQEFLRGHRANRTTAQVGIKTTVQTGLKYRNGLLCQRLALQL